MGLIPYKVVHWFCLCNLIFDNHFQVKLLGHLCYVSDGGHVHEHDICTPHSCCCWIHSIKCCPHLSYWYFKNPDTGMSTDLNFGALLYACFKYIIWLVMLVCSLDKKNRLDQTLVNSWLQLRFFIEFVLYQEIQVMHHCVHTSFESL